MNKTYLLCALALISMASCASTEPSLKEKKSDIFFEAGTEALRKGDFTDALKSLQEAAKYTPESPNVWNNLGLAYAAKKELKRAEDCWKKCLKLDKSFTDAHANLGALYLQQKRYAESERQLKIVEEDLVYPRAALAHFNLALVYLAQNKNMAAEQQLKLSVQADNAYCPAWYRLGVLQKGRGEFSEAAESTAKSLTGTCYKNPQAQYELGELYMKNKDMTAARAKLLEVIQLFPESEWAQKAEITLNTIR